MQLPILHCQRKYTLLGNRKTILLLQLQVCFYNVLSSTRVGDSLWAFHIQSDSFLDSHNSNWNLSGAESLVPSPENTYHINDVR